MSSVLVTGGLGFIGSHTVVELLSQGNDVTVIDDLSNSEIRILDNIEEIVGKRPAFYQADLTDLAGIKELFKKHKFDSVIHFAAKKAVGESVRNPLLYYRNNLISLFNVLELCETHEIYRLIFSSSCTVYGQPKELPVTEDTPVLPAESPYGNTKQIGEQIISDFCRKEQKMRAISLRYFNPTGAHDSGLIGELPLGVPENLIPYITQTAAGIREQLSVFGGDYDTRDGTCIRDYIHVVDLAKAHVAALELTRSMSDNYKFFNVGTGEGYTVLETIRSFEKVSGVKLNYKIVDRRPGDIEKIYADTTKANDQLNWKAERGLDNMMLTAWQWQQSLGQK